MNPIVDRKEIASAAGVSEDTVARNEDAWGLSEFRSKATKRRVSFFRAKTSERLLIRGIISSPLDGCGFVRRGA